MAPTAPVGGSGSNPSASDAIARLPKQQTTNHFEKGHWLLKEANGLK
jgi:hypothetical protein